MPKPENILGQGFHTDPSRINKKGRPKGSKSLSTILKNFLETEIDGETWGDKIVHKLVDKANKGDVRAIDVIFDRTEGKAKQEIKHDGLSDQSVTVNIQAPKDDED